MAIDNFKTADIIISNINQDSVPHQYTMQGDKNGRSMTVQVTNNGVVEPQSGLGLNLGWTHQTAKNKDGEPLQGLDNFKVIDQSIGLYRIEYPSAMMVPGNIHATIQFVTDEMVAHSKPFTIIVSETPFSEDAVISEDSFTTLQAALVEVKKLKFGPIDTLKSVAELNAKYPNGAQGTVVILESDGKTGYEYTWTEGAWKKGALRQAQGIADNSIESKKLSLGAVTQERTNFLGLGKNLLDPKRIVQGAYVDNPNGLVINSSGYAYYPYLPVEAGKELWIQADLAVRPRAFRKVCAYDSNMNVLGDLGWDNTSSDYSPYAIPSGVSFVTVSFNIAYLSNPLMICYGDSFIEFEEYQEVLGENVVLGEKQLSMIEKSELDGTDLLKDGSLPVSKAAFYEMNENIFEIGTEQTGYMDPNGYVAPNSGYYRTTRYPLKKGEKISVRGNTDKLVHMRKVAVFDSNGIPLTQFGLDRMPSDGTVSTYTAEDDAITEVVLSIGYSSTNYGIEPENLMISYGDVPDRFSRQMHNATPDIGVSDTQLKIIQEELNVEPSKLVGRTILSTGDSIQAGDGNKGTGFTEIAASQLGMICRDYAVGGATFCREIQPTNNIVDQLLKALQQETKAPDFLVTNGLTNDIGSPNAPIGSVTTSFNVSDYDLSTFSGSMEYYFYQVRSQWPSTKIIYVRVHNMATRGRAKQIEFGERAEEICYKWSVPVVNVYRDGNLNTNITEQRKLYSNPTEANPNGDSTHPNQAGYDFAYVPLLINQLKSM